MGRGGTKLNEDGADSVKVTTEELPQRQVLLQIEVDPERLEKAMDQAYRRVASRARVPGFRPGKAPRMIVERYLGRETLLHEALDSLVPEVYKEAIEQEGIKPVDQADFEFPQLEPVIVKATIPVEPRIDLGDYHALRIDAEQVTTDEKVVDDALEQLRHRYATVEPVQRSVQMGDLVRANVRAMVDGRVIYDQRDAEFPVSVEATAGLTGLAEHLVGMERGAKAEFAVEVPADAEEDADTHPYAGKSIVYTVQLHEIKEERLPELNDDFAQQVGEGFPTLQALRERLRNDARVRAETEAKRRYEQKALDALVERATVEYPPILLDREIDTLIRERVPDGGQRQALQRHLAAIGKSESEYRDEILPLAADRLVRSLVLGQLAEDEKLTVAPDEIDTEVEQIGAETGTEGERLRELLGGDAARRVLERSLLTRKSYERLAAIASGAEAGAKSEPELPEQAAAGPTQVEPVIKSESGSDADQEVHLSEADGGEISQ
jgi:trigger factor